MSEAVAWFEEGESGVRYWLEREPFTDTIDLVRGPDGPSAGLAAGEGRLRLSRGVADQLLDVAGGGTGVPRGAAAMLLGGEDGALKLWSLVAFVDRVRALAVEMDASAPPVERNVRSALAAVRRELADLDAACAAHGFHVEPPTLGETVRYPGPG